LAEEAFALHENHPAWAEADRRNAFRALSAVLTDLGDQVALEALHRKNLDASRAKVPADESRLAWALGWLIHTLLVAEKFTEAEPLARECLTIHEKQTPDDWVTFDAQSMLGGSLLGQKKYAEAEALLLPAYDGLKKREQKIPFDDKVRRKEALQRIVQLYEATGRPDKAAESNRELTEHNKAEAEKKNGPPKR
jgi:hypothetical protein